MAKRRYHPAFPLDLRNAILHFDGISPTLGEKFREDVREKLEIITKHPALYAPLAGEIRAARLSRFPYVILYAHDDESVYFISMVLGSSDRMNWLNRLE